MKKLFTLVVFMATILSYNGLWAQACTPNMSNTTPGFTPTPSTPITKGVAYSMCAQLYVPASVTVGGLTATIDSIKLDSIGGLPTGITYTPNPANGIVHGGGNGSILFTGTTNDTVGTYKLVFHGTATTNFGPFQMDQPPVSSQFSYVLTVVQASQAICDTLFNLQSPLDTPTVYLAASGTAAGYLSGNNKYGDLMKAEYFSGFKGFHATLGLFVFGVVKVNAGDSSKTVTVKVWDNTGTGGSPGAAIDSATLTFAQIATAVTNTFTNHTLTPNTVSFVGNAAIPGNGFYIGVVLPTTAGDTVALLTNKVPPGPDGKGWEYGDPGTGYQWVPYDTSWGIPGGSSLGNYIGAGVCGTENTPVAGFTASPTSGGCGTLTVTFTDTTTQNPLAWNWSFGDGSAASTAQNPTHTFTAAGTYTITESAANNVGSASATYTVTVTAPPTVTDSTHNATTASSTDGSAVVTATGGGPYTYKWSNNATTAGITGVAAGTYYVTVTGANTCSTVDTVVISHGTGINTLSSNVQIKIYPNPSNDALNFVWNVNAEAEIAIFDITGNLVRTYIVTGTAVNRFDIHDLASGTYVVRVTDKQNNEQRSSLFNKF